MCRETFIVFIIIFLFGILFACYRAHVTGAIISAAANNTVGGGETSPDKIKNLKLHPRSKFEEKIANIFTEITGKNFPTVLPAWLAYQGKRLELDGYNKELRIAFEAQGPLHTKFYPEKDTWVKYKSRLAHDREKIKKCKEYGVILVVVDMRVPTHLLKEYILSRLFDFGWLSERPTNYIPVIDPEPYDNYIYDSENNLTRSEPLSRK